MATAIVSTQVIGEDGTFESRATVTSDGRIVRNPSLAAAKVGALTTKTSSSVGELTMGAGHGITTGAKIDLYWVNTDGTRGYRRNITVGTVATNAVPISVGTGDDLPPDETAITAMVVSEQEFAYDKDDIVVFVFNCSYPAQFAVFDASDALIFSGAVDGTGDAYIWSDASGVTTPFSADPAYLQVTHGTADTSAVPLAVAYVN